MRSVGRALAVLACLMACSEAESPADVRSRIETAARQQGCTPYGDLEQTDVDADPWWVSLEPLTGGAGDSAFLCEPRPGADPLLLLDVQSDRNPWAGCATVVGELFWAPSGVSLLTPEDPAYPAGTLGAWEDSAGSPGPADVPLTGPVIDTSLQIAGALFYCHEGTWLTRFEH